MVFESQHSQLTPCDVTDQESPEQSSSTPEQGDEHSSPFKIEAPDIYDFAEELEQLTFQNARLGMALDAMRSVMRALVGNPNNDSLRTQAYSLWEQYHVVIEETQVASKRLIDIYRRTAPITEEYTVGLAAPTELLILDTRANEAYYALSTDESYKVKQAVHVIQRKAGLKSLEEGQTIRLAFETTLTLEALCMALETQFRSPSREAAYNINFLLKRFMNHEDIKALEGRIQGGEQDILR